jgi:ABC-type Na+ efflux pump permease subunit
MITQDKFFNNSIRLMRKILTIAVREYRAMVATKAFLISIIMMPLLMLGGLIAMEWIRKSGGITERRIAVFDPDGIYFTALQAAGAVLGSEPEAKSMQKGESNSVSNKLRKNDEDRKEMLGLQKERYVFERIEGERFTDEMGLALSKRVRSQELYAYLVIPPNVEQLPELEQALKEPKLLPQILFYAENASLSDARLWMNEIINGVVRIRRFVAAKLDPELVQKLSLPVPIVGMGLITRSADGQVNAKVENDPLSAIFLPMGVMMLMFMVIFMAAQPMLESVLEEKSQRIAEVLLGSASSFQLMAGKLIGTVAGSFTIFLIYLAGAWGMAIYRDWTEQVPLTLIPWFMVFQILGVLFYAAIFLAIGASVSQLKEAQSLLLPVWMLMMSPMFVWIFIVRNPLSGLATYFSLFPPATPTAMMLRLATGQTIPLWQPTLGVILLLLTTFGIVVLAARIFRVGILWQGKTPKLTEIFKWAFTG